MAAGETARADGATVAEGTVDLIEPVTSWWTDTLAAIGRLYRRASRSVWYDYTLRVPAIAVFYLLAAAQLEELNHHVIAVTPAVERFGVIAEDATNLVALVMFLVLSILRSRPLARAEGFSPRVTALLGTYGLGILLLFAPRPEPSVNWQIISSLIAALGEIGIVVVLFHLGRSFSIMAEARRLVTTGPYRFVRHPLYAVEEIVLIGIFLQFRSVTAALFLGAHFLMQLYRMQNEERVLARAFPEYEAYKRCTARLIPRLF